MLTNSSTEQETRVRKKPKKRYIFTAVFLGIVGGISLLLGIVLYGYLNIVGPPSVPSTDMFSPGLYHQDLVAGKTLLILTVILFFLNLHTAILWLTNEPKPRKLTIVLLSIEITWMGLFSLVLLLSDLLLPLFIFWGLLLSGLIPVIKTIRLRDLPQPDTQS